MKKNKTLMILAVIMLAMAASATADVYLEMSNSSQHGDREEWNVRMWLNDRYIRTDEPEGNTYSITDFENERLITIDTKKREYYVISMDQVRSDMQRASAAMKQRIELKWRVEAGNERKTIAGHECRLLHFRGSGSLLGEEGSGKLRIKLKFWLADSVVEGAGSMLKMLELMGMQSNPFISTDIMAELKKSSGFVFSSTSEFTNGADTFFVEQAVDSFEYVEKELSFYQVPKGYKEVTPPKK